VTVQAGLHAVLLARTAHVLRAARGDQPAGPAVQPFHAGVIGVVGRHEAVWRQEGQRVLVEAGVHDVAAAVERDGEPQARAGVHQRDAPAGTAQRMAVERAGADAAELVNVLKLGGINACCCHDQQPPGSVTPHHSTASVA